MSRDDNLIRAILNEELSIEELEAAIDQRWPRKRSTTFYSIPSLGHDYSFTEGIWHPPMLDWQREIYSWLERTGFAPGQEPTEDLGYAEVLETTQTRMLTDGRQEESPAE